METIVLLSIGKLGTGQSAYYLEQAGGSVTRVQAVRTGVEDYYLGGPEATGVWCGAGTSALGLGGEVAAEPRRGAAGRRRRVGGGVRAARGLVPGFASRRR